MVKNYRAESKARALNYYEGYVARLQKADKPVYIVMGKPYWKRFVIEHIKAGIGKSPEIINNNLKLYTQKLRYKTLGKRKHFYHYIYTGESLSTPDFEALRDYLNSPSKYGILLLEIDDWKSQKTFERYFSYLKDSKSVSYINTNYYKHSFKDIHIRSLLMDSSIDFETGKLKNIAIKNLMQNYDELNDNILTLDAIKDEDDIVSKSDYYQSIEQYSDATKNKLFDSLAKVNRKKIPYEVVKELLEDGENPSTILYGIQRHLTYLYQAKYLKLNGIIRRNDIESEKKVLYDKGPLKFPEDIDIWELSQSKRNSYLDDCEEVSLRELIQSLLIVDNSFIQKRIVTDGEVEYIKYTTKERLMMCIIEIMNRREEK